MPDQRTFDFNTLEGIYKALSPQLPGGGISKLNKKDYVAVPAIEQLKQLLLPNNGQFYRYETIKSLIDPLLSSNNNEQQKQLLKRSLHIVSSSDNDPYKKTGDDTYWQSSGEKTDKSFFTRIPDYDPALGRVSMFVIRDNQLNPSNRSTNEIDIFLNNIPSIFASQMVPYLNVEFQLMGSFTVGKDKNTNNLSSPSIIKFLMGSNADGNIALTDADKAMLETISGAQNEKDTSFSGMEMFLMPQTLTNMDGLVSDGVRRVVDAKPFLPFASIEGMEINVANAGAGKMAHKTGTLRLKIHDKSRIGEMSAFLRGGAGFSDATIWTTYGWVAPRGRGDDDVYAKFINENMLNHEAWTVKNSSFSFDAAGQVALTLELVSKFVNQINEARISSGATADLKRLEEIANHVVQIRAAAGDRLNEVMGFVKDVRITQILDGAATGRLPDLDGPALKEAIRNTVAALRLTGNVSDADLNGIEQELNSINPKDGDLTKKIKSSAEDSLKRKFIACATNIDPFLVSEDRTKGDNSYFDSRLWSRVSIDADKKVEIPSPKSGAPNILRQGKRYVSFGKLFLYFVAPSIIRVGGSSDELQLVFYKLNDHCGPVSGLSVAEFPIDMARLEYAYEARLEETGVTDMTVQDFLQLVIASQFNDNRSVAYGMTDAYEYFNPSEKEEKPTKEYATKMEKWMREWGGSFTRPVIEMQIESGTESSPQFTSDLLSKYQSSKRDAIKAGASLTNKVTRIHIYDKQSKLGGIANVFKTADGWAVAELDDEAIRKRSQEVASLDADVQQANNEILFGQPGGPPIVEATKSGAIKILKSFGRKGIQAYLSQKIPTISVGSNGTMVLNASVASKTDSLQGSINIIKANKATGGTVAPPVNTAADPDNLPLRVVPAQVTMTTMGCPIGQLYQKYFIDFNTGTTLDNIYSSSQVQHSLAPGKFTTTWTFIFEDAYGKFYAPASMIAAINDKAKEFAKKDEVTAPRQTSKKASNSVVSLKEVKITV